VVTKTKLASLQTGGKVDLAAARLVGINMGSTLDKLAMLAGEASTNIMTVDGGLASALTGADIMSADFFDKMYNKLSRIKIPTINGAYV
ncbi:hypothetical protein NL317_29025, partial [Klebsiella pneumoniae]|nr:hypothetical protein [Klebsiella pneumoniae]